MRYFTLAGSLAYSLNYSIKKSLYSRERQSITDGQHDSLYPRTF